MKRLMTILWMTMICIFSINTDSYGTQIKVKGLAEDTYIVFDSDGKRVGDAKTIPDFGEDGVEVDDGKDYVVKLNNVSEDVSVSGNDVEKNTGSVIVYGLGFDSYNIYDLSGIKLGGAVTNEYTDMFKGDYIIKLNNTEPQSAINLTPGNLYPEVAGAILVNGFGDDRYYVYDSQDNELGSKSTQDYIELFPGNYTVKLNNTRLPASVSAAGITSLDAGAICVTGVGQDSFFAYDGDTDLGSKKTNERLEVFPGTYTVSLNNMSRSATVTPLSVTPDICAGYIKVTGSGSSSFSVFLSSAPGEALASAKTNESIELFDGNFIVNLNGVERTAEVFNCSTQTIDSGSVTVSGKGEDDFYLLDPDQNQLAGAKPDEAVDLFPEPDPYTVTLNGVSRTVLIEANVDKVLGTGNLTVSGTGNDGVEIYDSGGGLLKTGKTNELTDLFDGTYTVKLNNTVRTPTIQIGVDTVIDAGSLLVSGTSGTYFVYDQSDKFLASGQLNNELEFFPGTYVVKCNNLSQQVDILAGRQTQLTTGTITVTGNGLSEYYVYDSLGVQLAKVNTGESVELFESSNDTFTVELNNVSVDVSFANGATIEIGTAALLVRGTGSNTYFVYDSSGQAVASAKTNEEVELLAGTYVVELNGSQRTIVVQTSEVTVRKKRAAGDDGYLSSALAVLQFCAGMDNGVGMEMDVTGNGVVGVEDAIYFLQMAAELRSGKIILLAGAVSVPGKGNDLYYVFDSGSVQLALANTGNLIELFPGTFTVRLNTLEESADVVALQTTTLDAGSLTVSNPGFFGVKDAQSNPLRGNVSSGAYVELFPGTYIVTYNAAQKTVMLQAGEEKTVQF